MQDLAGAGDGVAGVVEKQAGAGGSLGNRVEFPSDVVRGMVAVEEDESGVGL